MADYTAEKVEVNPYFDIELLMTVSQESRIGGDTMQRLAGRWEAWVKELNAYKVNTGKIEYLVVWLNEAVEADVDSMWESSPSDAYIVGALAQVMCMTVVHDVMPHIQEVGCAPAPKPTEKLQEALADLGIPYNEPVTALSRRYAVVTHHPFKGGCEICYLQKDCPKGSGAGNEPATFELPGFEYKPL